MQHINIDLLTFDIKFIVVIAKVAHSETFCFKHSLKSGFTGLSIIAITPGYD